MGWGKIKSGFKKATKNIVSGVVNPVKQIAKGDVMGGLGGLAYGTMVNPFMQTGGAMLQSGEAQKLYAGFGQAAGQAMGGAQQNAQASSPYSGVQANNEPQTGGAFGAYPAMPNEYGLGEQPAEGAGAAGTSGNPVSVKMADSSSRGFNPWSLQGESNVRDDF